MRDLMQDVETLGVRSGSVLPALGAAFFDAETGEIGATFYREINIASSLALGATTDASTLDWWKKQKPEAQALIFNTLSGGVSLTCALADYREFIAAHCPLKSVRIWGNGADFDQALVAAAYHQVGQQPPWTPWNSRCFRTLKNLYPGHEPTREGVHHNALADALHQAKWAVAILRNRRAV